MVPLDLEGQSGQSTPYILMGLNFWGGVLRKDFNFLKHNGRKLLPVFRNNGQGKASRAQEKLRIKSIRKMWFDNL